MNPLCPRAASRSAAQKAYCAVGSPPETVRPPRSTHRAPRGRGFAPPPQSCGALRSAAPRRAAGPSRRVSLRLPRRISQGRHLALTGIEPDLPLSNLTLLLETGALLAPALPGRPGGERHPGASLRHSGPRPRWPGLANTYRSARAAGKLQTTLAGPGQCHAARNRRRLPPRCGRPAGRPRMTGRPGPVRIRGRLRRR